MRILLLLSILLSHYSYGQKCPDDSLFALFKKDIQIELLKYKQVEWDDETRESYYTLMASCPIESLAKYVEDSIPAVRCLVFVGLAQKNANDGLLSEIVSNHKNDSAEYTDSPTDVATTWTVQEFMQTTLKWKIDKKIPNAAGDYESRLKTIRNRVRIIIPGEYHGIVSRDSLLTLDSLTCSAKGYRVVSFTLTDGTTTITTNNIFTYEIKEYIKGIRFGDLLSIENIRIEKPDKSSIKIAGLTLEVK